MPWNVLICSSRSRCICICSIWKCCFFQRVKCLCNIYRLVCVVEGWMTLQVWRDEDCVFSLPFMVFAMYWTGLCHVLSFWPWMKMRFFFLLTFVIVTAGRPIVTLFLKCSTTKNRRDCFKWFYSPWRVQVVTLGMGGTVVFFFSFFFPGQVGGGHWKADDRLVQQSYALVKVPGEK